MGASSQGHLLRNPKMSQNPWILGVFVLLGVCSFITSCEGRRMCYVCDTTTSGLDCLYNPDNITSTGEDEPLPSEKPCRHYCTIRREEFINIPGTITIISLKRDCQEKPQMLDGVVAGGYFMTYYRSCRSNLCNDGDGLNSLKHIEDEPDEDYEEENSSFALHYCQTSLRIFKIYFFVFVASIFSIT